MRRLLRILIQSPLLTTGVVVVVCICIAAAAAEGPPQDTPAALQRLQNQLDQQTKRIDRLYRALGPHLEESAALGQRGGGEMMG